MIPKYLSIRHMSNKKTRNERIVKKNCIIKNILPLLSPNRKYIPNPFITLPTNL